jgi:tryptophanyl-tRNA synthetase
MLRLLTSAPPTGPLHFGHYRGAIAPFVTEMEGCDEAYFTIADVHMLAPRADRDVTAGAPGRCRTLVAECVAAGIDPRRCSFYRQSAIPELSLMHTLLQNLVTVDELSRQAGFLRRGPGPGNPLSLGLLGWPVLESADIIGTGATHVAVGAGNAGHVALCRTLLDRLDRTWGTRLPRPVAVVSTLDLPGLDGAPKMSRSGGNTVALRAGRDELATSLAGMTMWAQDGRCVPAVYLDALGRSEEGARVAAALREQTMTPDAARELLLAALTETMEPVGKRIADLEKDPGFLDSLLDQGTERVRELAAAGLQTLRRGLGLVRA